MCKWKPQMRSYHPMFYRVFCHLKWSLYIRSSIFPVWPAHLAEALLMKQQRSRGALGPRPACWAGCVPGWEADGPLGLGGRPEPACLQVWLGSQLALGWEGYFPFCTSKFLICTVWREKEWLPFKFWSWNHSERGKVLIMDLVQREEGLTLYKRSVNAIIM